MNPEREHIRLLAIFYWVVAAFSALFSLFPVIHLVVGIGMVSGHFPGAKGQAPLEFIGWFFIAFAALLIACGLAFSICLALAGRSLYQLRHYTFCLVMAGFACMFIPFGTVLGVLTLVVLTKEPSKELFAESPSSGS
jgi:hypothetical protein